MRSNSTAPWRVIYIARDEQQAHNIEELLTQAGFLIERKHLPSEHSTSEDIEIRALDSEAEEARIFLMEQGL